MPATRLALGRTLVWVALFAGAGPAAAGSGDDGEPAPQPAGLYEVVVRASRPTVADVATVDEVDARDLQAMGARDLGETLSLVPSVQPVPYCPCKGEGELMLRGYDQKNVRVLVDGVPLGETARNGRTGFPLSELGLGQVDRIKVVKGVPSVLYGSNAYGGVVNVVTRRAEGDRPALRLSASHGLANTRDYSVGHGWRLGRLDYWVSGSLRSGDGYQLSADYDPADYRVTPGHNNDPTYEDGGLRDNAGYVRLGGAARLSYHPSDDTALALLYRVHHGEQGLEIPPNPQLPMDKYSWYWRFPGNTSGSLALLGRTRLADALDLRARVSWSGSHEELVAYSDATWSRRSWQMLSDTSVLGGHLDAGVDLGVLGRLRAGLDLRTEREERQRTLGDTAEGWEPLEVLHGSVGVEDEISLLDSLVVNVGASYNLLLQRELPAGGTPRDSLSALCPQIGVAYAPLETLRVHASAGRKVSFPRMKDMYPVGQWNPMFQTANLDLQPEEVLALEAGVRGQYERIVRGGVSVFRDTVDNMVESGLAPSGGMWMENKEDRRTIQGVEATLDLRLPLELTVGGSYTWLHTREEATGEQVLFRPPHTARAYLRHTHGFGLTAQLDVQVSSDERTKLIERMTMPGPKPQFGYRELGAYVLLNLRLAQRLADHWVAFVHVDNLLDSDFQDGFCPRRRIQPRPGRMIRGGIRVDY